MAKIKEVNKKERGKALTLFLIMFPSLLIAGNYGSLAVNLFIKICLIFYQFVILKRWLDEYYEW
jgi:hypothetical protein